MDDELDAPDRMTEDEVRRRLTRLSPSGTATRAREALRLRLAGVPCHQIAETLDLPEFTVQMDIRRQLERTLGRRFRLPDGAAGDAELDRVLALERLEALLAGSWEKAIRGSVAATTIVLKAMQQQARLLGLDAPQKIDITQRLRQLAEREGWDPDELIAEARQIVKSLPKP